MSTLPRPRRVAMISVHTSPLERPGTGDAGGMNVYVVETAKQLARQGVEVEIFTRRTTAAQPETVELVPGVLVRHIDAGPFEGLGKDDLPGQLCAFTVGVQRLGAAHPEGYFDLVHSHYWLSGQVAWLAADRWQVPLVHSMHTMARVKNSQLADGDRPEPPGREIGEQQVVRAAAWLVANTEREASELIDLYDADPAVVRVIPPGVDLETFTPGDRDTARAHVGLPPDAEVLLFVGRIQPLKAPDVLVRAAADLLERDPGRRDRLVVAVLGGPSGSGLDHPESLADLVEELGLGDVVRLVPPVERDELAQWYRAADVLAVPSYNESFGLVAVEAQACGTPVVAAAVGGLPTAVGDGGVLLDSHDPAEWGRTLGELLDDTERRSALAERAVAHAAGFGWERTTERLLTLYRAACDGEAAPAPDPASGLAGIPTAVIP
ncbi:D-inositol-3-phosphate glycosyltransferase [Luteipulveratus flavus]|uniref:D-inositol-3-phosphate glycosyltransferase n=1 Tax=Luteipulveratus flavus TaxID=3031728 RepID=A0ABT6CAZ7_9MICO|nr:D-inositol-3-phosphate glycosyltransferase [Luteipulveratus sp. YIM 133296]MDF8265547.1 D-inositol-3-phosphate glycosyltransferase [Luteipulveratus sp. YIM 133296]